MTPRFLRVIIAPDSFKGSLKAADVAAAIADGWRSVRPGDDLVLIPQADGGEGTLDAIESSVPGAVRRAAGTVTGPDGRPVPGEWLELPGGGVAVVELAQASGLPLMGTPDAVGASTRGLGETIRVALTATPGHAVPSRLVIALGGSASTDAGTGALRALGLELLDSDRHPIGEGGGELARVASVDASRLMAPPSGGVTVLTDVAAPLLGPTGAAAVFGPQKGASPEQVRALDSALAHFASLTRGDPEAPGSGAAGGTAFGFATLWGATIAPGADYLAELTGLRRALVGADLLLTGEGRFDAQSLTGKMVGHLLAAARASGVVPGVIAGQVVDDVREAAGVWAASVSDLAGSVDAALADPARWLREAGARAARELAG